MKKSFKLLFASLAITLGIGAAAVAGVSAHSFAKEAEPVNAASSVTINGSWNSWGTGTSFTNSGNGVFTLSNFVVSDYYNFKIVVDGSNWCGGGVQDLTDDYTKYVLSNNTDGGNMWFARLGTYSLKVETNNSNKLTVTAGQVVTNAVSLAGNFNSWTAEKSGYILTNDNGTYKLEDIELSSGDSFKIVIRNDDSSFWCGGYCLDDSDTFTSKYFPKQTSGDDANISVSLAGIYSFYFVPNNKSNYGTLTISGELDTITVTIRVTFASAVQEWVDVYIPGSFIDWGGNGTKMTANAARTEYTLATEVVPDTYTYKLMTCYKSKGFSWTNNIDSSNQSVTFAASDDGTTKTIRTSLAVPSMPQEYAPEGAVVTLTFGSKVASTISIYYVGLLTNWSNTSADLASGLMSANTGRTVFTYTIPEETMVGTYEYKIVAMSSYSGATKAVYDYIVYGTLETNEELDIDDTTMTYALNANSTDLSELGAVSYAQYFKGQTGPICSTTSTSADHYSALSGIWSTLKSTFEDLPSGAKTNFGSSSDTDVADARERYQHILSRYALSAFDGGPSASYKVTVLSFINNDSSIIVIVATCSLIMAGAVGGYFLLRRKKEKNI